MTRTFVIAGLLLLALILPMAALPVAVFGVVAPLVFALLAAGTRVFPQSPALSAPAAPRAPPSR